MNDAGDFAGFSKKTLTFLAGLEKNNTKEWFEANKPVYEEHVLEPSRAFVVAMGQRLTEIAPEIQAVPKVNGSLFRINRDTRFSADKSPYKPNVGILFWEGAGPRMECSGYYFHLEPKKLMLGAGLYLFPKDLLEIYREAAVDQKLGPALRQAVDAVGRSNLAADQTGCGMPIERLKRVPPGYDASHPNAELLKYKGLHAGIEAKIPEAFFRPDLVEYCFERFAKLAPLHRWLVTMLERRP